MSRLQRFLSLPKEEKKIKLKNFAKRKINMWIPNKRFIPNGYKNDSKAIYEGPKISVLMPIYNHVDVAIKSIDSVLNQTYKNIELIILDDGSKDDLLDKLKPYMRLSNVKVYTQDNQKLPRALTHLHQLASGDFITWTSADNIMKTTMIERLVEKLLMDPYTALVYGDVTVIDSKDRPFYGPCRDIERDIKTPKIIRLSRTPKPLSIGTDNYINASFLYRKENSDVLMGIYSDDIIGAEDYDYWLRLNKTGKLSHIKDMETYYYYRVHENSMSHELETKKIKIHQSRLENLRKYEQERIKWHNTRCNILIDKSLNKSTCENLNSLASYLPVTVVDTIDPKTSKNLVFCSEKHAGDVYVKVENEYYSLINSKLDKCIVKIFVGLDIPREAYRARNMYSHSFYQDDLTPIKKPIIGCHVNSKTVDIVNIKEILANNQNVHFVLLDETENTDVAKLKETYPNFTYYSNREFGIEYQTYSHFSRIISFKDSSISNKYKNILLAYAIGRKISYNREDSFYKSFPYTIPLVNYNMSFYTCDGINDEDYDTMDKFIEFYSHVESLNRIIKYYSAHTQEMYIDRPKYEVEFIPPESSPRLVGVEEHE